MAIEIDKNKLPDNVKQYLELSKTDVEMSLDCDDQYLIRLLIDKVNELTKEVNTIKDALSGD